MLPVNDPPVMPTNVRVGDRVVVPVAVQLVVPRRQRRVVNIEHDRLARGRLAAAGLAVEPARCLGSHAFGFGRVVAVHVQSQRPARRRATAGGCARRAVVVLELETQDVDVRDLVGELGRDDVRQLDRLAGDDSCRSHNEQKDRDYGRP